MQTKRLLRSRYITSNINGVKMNLNRNHWIGQNRKIQCLFCELAKRVIRKICKWHENKKSLYDCVWTPPHTGINTPSNKVESFWSAFNAEAHVCFARIDHVLIYCSSCNDEMKRFADWILLSLQGIKNPSICFLAENFFPGSLTTCVINEIYLYLIDRNLGKRNSYFMPRWNLFEH